MITCTAEHTPIEFEYHRCERPMGHAGAHRYFRNKMIVEFGDAEATYFELTTQFLDPKDLESLKMEGQNDG